MLYDAILFLQFHKVFPDVFGGCFAEVAVYVGRYLLFVHFWIFLHDSVHLRVGSDVLLGGDVVQSTYFFVFG